MKPRGAAVGEIGMSIIVGNGDYRYEQLDSWGKLPPGMVMGEVGAVGVDSKDNVYVFNRGAHPMMIFDRQGEFLRSWGNGLFPRAHGLHMAPDGTVFLTDDGDHSVRQCTLDGKVLLTLGTPGKPAEFMSGEPFHRCTHTALSPSGDIYVSDGYGNARVHKYAPDGRHLLSWGESGTKPGEFNLVHNITCDPDGWVYVADRENHRIQVFDGNGKYQAQLNNLHRPCALFQPYCSCPICYVGELGPATRTNRNYKNLGPRLSIIDNEGNLLARIGGMLPGIGAGDYMGPHGITVDSHGDIYVAEVSHTQWKQYFPDQPMPSDLRVIRKLRKLE
jgi:hypothetical protein